MTARVPAALNRGSLAVAIGFGFTAAVLFSQFFMTPFVELLGRALFLSMVLLLVFIGAQRVPERWVPAWLPRWLLTVVAVGLAAPAGTFVIYLVAVGGSVSALVDNPARVTGFFVFAGTALVLGLVITLTAQLREREARARSQALEFELERSRLAKQAVDAQLALLQAQIEPHFLFNTLANVQALVEARSPRAPQVLESLIAYLRAAMPRVHGVAHTLTDELALTRAYLELMQLRMPDRLRFEIDADPALGTRRLPPLTLLTLVENAVRHGIDPSEEGGRIEVGARLGGDGAFLHLWVQDSGVGLDPAAPRGTGLTNLQARLTALHGPAARLQFTEVEPRGMRAEVVLPPP